MTDWPVWFCVLFALGITAGGLVQRVLGFGYAVVALGVIPYVMEIRTANLAVSFSLLVPLFWMLWLQRRQLTGLPLIECLLGAAAGLPVGLFIFGTADREWLVRGTGLVILWIALDGLVRQPRARADANASRVWGALAGAASGLLAGSVAVGGPPVAAYAARQPWTPRQFKGFIVAYSVVLSSLKAAGVIAAGFVTREVVVFTVAAIPFGLLGASIGAAVSRRINARLFRKLTFLLLAISAGSLLGIGQVTGPTAAAGSPPARRSAQASHDGLPFCYLGKSYSTTSSAGLPPSRVR